VFSIAPFTVGFVRVFFALMGFAGIGVGAISVAVSPELCSPMGKAGVFPSISLRWPLAGIAAIGRVRVRGVH
jgi:hypothetical protein